MTTAALLAGMLLMAQPAVPSPPLDYPALAERLVRPMALQPGEKRSFFTDATLTAGGQVWVRDGKLTVP